jgi:hypothetical protein
MKDPTSKLTDMTEFERQLLDAARREQIPHELKLRMGEVLRTPQAAGLGVTRSHWLQSKPAAWLLASGLVLGSAAAWQQLRAPQHAQTTASGARPVASLSASGPNRLALATDGAKPPAAAPSVLAEPEADGVRPAAVLPSVLAEPAADGVRPPAVTPSASSAHPRAGSLRDEIALLDRARAALQEKAANQALGLLSQYARRFAHGSLVPEAAALHIDALAMRGESARANEEAQRFLRDYPQHPLAQRMQRWLAPSPTAAGLVKAR